MLQILYLVAFTILAVLAIGNLIRSLIVFSMDAPRRYPPGVTSPGGLGRGPFAAGGERQRVPHPELLDDTGNVINEPLLVMRSINIDDARSQLDALYKSSPGNTEETSDE